MQKYLEDLPKIEIIKQATEKPGLTKHLPETPGIYSFFDNEKVIYIGKAINIKRRVASYFDLDLDTKTDRMVTEAKFLSFIQVTSELEALLLEAKLIRKYMPRYNIAAKDDKHPLYIIITKDLYPRIITARKADIERVRNLAVYGPFPSSSSVRSVLRFIRRIFPYSDHKLGKRPCLYSHIGLCYPCPNEVERIKNNDLRIMNRKKYLKNIKNIKTILDGKINSLQKDLVKEMEIASKFEKYEEALQIRKKISDIEYITKPQMPADAYMQNPNLYEDQREKEMTDLKNIIKNYKIKIKNCTRIECYDIAHLAGTNATASMVTFINGQAEKEFYRQFKIRAAKGGDDYGSLAEVARRRATHFSDWGKPDLIIVDGGIGQVKAFSQKIKAIDNAIPVVGIAKQPDRLIVISDTSDKSAKSERPEDFSEAGKIQKIKLEGGALNLVSRMRDEAHRFARRYHHKLVSKALTNPEA